MEAMGADVSQKIRSAIKAKLIELGVYIDDELPDYIMVMVANKKTKGQMDDDLHLFLATNTSKFTTWLHEVLERLQSVTSDSTVKKGNQSVKTTATQQETDNYNYDVQDEVLALKAEQEEDDLLAEELALNKPPSDPSLPSKDKRKQNVVSPVQRIATRATKRSAPTRGPSLQKRRAPSSTVGAVLSRPAESDDDDDDDDDDEDEDATNFHSTGIASVVKISARRSSVPLNLQANKNLLMKAVAEAKKSVLAASKRKISEMTDQVISTRPQLFTRKHRAMSAAMSAAMSNANPNAAVVLPRKSTVDVRKYEEAIAVFEEFMQVDDNEAPKRCIIADNENENKGVVSPTFIVTLDGVDPTTFSSKQLIFKEQQSVSESELIDLDEDDYEMLIDSDEIENSEKESNAKSGERCKYWPICKNGGECSYQHPSVQCKTFPNCRFGDKCHYIHPNCKYDATCTRQNCPFTHASRRILTAMPPAIVLAPKFRTSSGQKDQQCKFYPKCSNLNCSFYHPKPCRYGLSCTQSGCSFFHPPLPSRDKLKWKSTCSASGQPMGQAATVNSG